MWDIGHQWDIDRDIGMRYELSIWDMVYRYGHLPYRYGHPGYRYGIWANDMGEDSIDMVILDIDMGYLVTLLPTIRPCPCTGVVAGLVWFFGPTGGLESGP